LDSILAGTYIVLVTDSLGCIDSASIEVTELTGIIQSSLINTGLKIYPNPNDGNFQIDYQLPHGHDGILVIFDVMGRKLLSEQLKGGNNKLIIKNTAIKNGLYFYKVFINDRLKICDKLLIIK
ncbi:MAG: T9SS type A sorting domain-containing protein, partial [Bacteroidetes bacterium]|nr:T9SS type A sorting domain-containing protein [Bacteroidota bacterium]